MSEKNTRHFKGIVIIDNDPIKNLDFHDEESSSDDSTISSSSSTSERSRKGYFPRPKTADKQTQRSRFQHRRTVSEFYDSDSINSDTSSIPSYSSSLYGRSGRQARKEDIAEVGGIMREEKPKKPSKWASYNNLNMDSTQFSAHHFMLFLPGIEGFALLAKKWSRLS